MSTELLKAVAEAFDEFIIKTGGNLDPRGACNRDRKALMHFYHKMNNAAGHDFYADLALTHAMERVIQGKITSHDFKSKEAVQELD